MVRNSLVVWCVTPSSYITSWGYPCIIAREPQAYTFIIWKHVPFVGKSDLSKASLRAPMYKLCSTKLITHIFLPFIVFVCVCHTNDVHCMEKMYYSFGKGGVHMRVYVDCLWRSIEYTRWNYHSIRLFLIFFLRVVRATFSAVHMVTFECSSILPSFFVCW